MAPKAKKCLLVFFSSPTWHTEHVSSSALFRVRVSCSQKLDTHDKRQARAWARAAVAKLERPRAWPQGTATPPRAQHILCQLHVCNTLGPHRSIKTQFLFSCFTLFLSTRSLLDRTKAKTIVTLPSTFCACSAWARSTQDRRINVGSIAAGPKYFGGFHCAGVHRAVLSILL